MTLDELFAQAPADVSINVFQCGALYQVVIREPEVTSQGFAYIHGAPDRVQALTEAMERRLPDWRAAALRKSIDDLLG